MSEFVRLDEGIYLLDAFYAAYPRRNAIYIIESAGEVALVDTGTAMSAVYVMNAPS